MLLSRKFCRLSIDFFLHDCSYNDFISESKDLPITRLAIYRSISHFLTYKSTHKPVLPSPPPKFYINTTILLVLQLMSEGQKEYFSSGWNWIDISMIFLMLCSYFMWGVMYFINPLHKKKQFQFFISFADGFFAVAIVLSFFRMVYLCQITRFLGLLQLCLGRMLQVWRKIVIYKFLIKVYMCTYRVKKSINC